MLLLLNYVCCNLCDVCPISKGLIQTNQLVMKSRHPSNLSQNLLSNPFFPLCLLILCLLIILLFCCKSFLKQIPIRKGVSLELTISVRKHDLMVCLSLREMTCFYFVLFFGLFRTFECQKCSKDTASSMFCTQRSDKIQIA